MPPQNGGHGHAWERLIVSLKSLNAFKRKVLLSRGVYSGGTSSPSNDLFLALWKSQQIYCITGRPNLRIRLFNLPCWNESRGIGGFKVSDAILNLLFSPLCLHRLQIYLYCYIEGIPLRLHPLHYNVFRLYGVGNLESPYCIFHLGIWQNFGMSEKQRKKVLHIFHSGNKITSCQP